MQTFDLFLRGMRSNLRTRKDSHLRNSLKIKQKRTFPLLVRGRSSHLRLIPRELMVKDLQYDLNCYEIMKTSFFSMRKHDLKGK